MLLKEQLLFCAVDWLKIRKYILLSVQYLSLFCFTQKTKYAGTKDYLMTVLLWLEVNRVRSKLESP
jgi:hypothetical protein